MRAIATLFCVALTATAANAAFDLQITEIWPGNEPGENLTSDWFEVTNVGDMAYVSATDGDLYFDDDSQDFTTADLISGVSTIAPGESVVFIDDADTAEFVSVWGSAVILPQLGTYNGSGLSQGGDGVTLFLSMGAPTGLTDIIDFETYPAADLNGGQSYDVLLGEFSTVGNANGALATIVVNDVDQPAVGSIGPAVPEPTALAIAAIAACGFAASRRR